MRRNRMNLTGDEIRADTERWLSKAVKFVRDPKSAYEKLVISLHQPGGPPAPAMPAEGDGGSKV